jgi:hypothetical protein
MTLRFASASNTFVPEATGQVIAYVRDPKEFKINEYVQYVPAPKNVGLYASFGRDAFVRIVSDAEFAWQDGDERPRGLYNQVPFSWTEFRTFRRAYPWTLGDQAIEMSSRQPAHQASASGHGRQHGDDEPNQPRYLDATDGIELDEYRDGERA